MKDIQRVKLTLVGANAGKDIDLSVGDFTFHFKGGSVEFEGAVEDLLGVCAYMERSYQAFPDPSQALNEARARIEGDDSVSETDESRAGGNGAGPADGTAGNPEENADDGAGDDKTPPGSQEPGPLGEGDRISQALARLSAGADDDWTSEGKPKVSRVAELASIPDLTRAQIELAQPGFSRSNLKEKS